MKNEIVNGRKREANMIDHNRQKKKEQVDFVHKPNQHLLIESRPNLFDYWIVHFMNGLLNRETKSFFH